MQNDRRETMGRNSHRFDIDESAKPFSSKVTAVAYDLAVLSKEEFIAKYRVKPKEYLRLMSER